MRAGELRIELNEWGKDEFSENYEVVFGLTSGNEEDLLPMEIYYDYCRRFAAVLGFAEKTISEWFD